MLRDNYAKTFAGGLTKVKHYQRKDGTDFEAQLFARPVAGHADIAIAVILDLAVTDSLRAGAVHSS